MFGHIDRKNLSAITVPAPPAMACSLHTAALLPLFCRAQAECNFVRSASATCRHHCSAACTRCRPRKPASTIEVHDSLSPQSGCRHAGKAALRSLPVHGSRAALVCSKADRVVCWPCRPALHRHAACSSARQIAASRMPCRICAPVRKPTERSFINARQSAADTRSCSRLSWGRPAQADAVWPAAYCCRQQAS